MGKMAQAGTEWDNQQNEEAMKASGMINEAQNRAMTQQAMLGRLGVSQDRAAVYGQNVGNLTGNRDQRTAIAQQRADASTQLGGPVQQHLVTSAYKAGDQFSAQAIQNQDMNREIDDIETVLQKEPSVMGSTAMTRIGNFLSQNLGIQVNGTTPNGLDIASKNANDLQTQMIRSRLGGSIGRQAFQEIQMVGNGVLGMKTNPQAAMAMMEKIRHLNDIRSGVAAKWESLGANGQAQAALSKGGFQGWLDSEYRDALGNSAPDGSYAPTQQPSVQMTPEGPRSTIPGAMLPGQAPTGQQVGPKKYQYGNITVTDH
jgi:hypothetical protein